MNTRAKWILAAALALMVASGVLLRSVQTHQRLGVPGVRIVPGALLDPAGKVVATNLVFLPETVLSMTSTQLPLSRVELDWLPADTTYGRRRYVDTNGFGVDIGVVVMGTDRTSIHQPQYCLTGQGFAIDQSDRLKIPMSRPESYDLEVVRLLATYVERLPDGTTRTWRGVYVYWFVADKQMTADHMTRMWWLARDLLVSGVLQRWAYISYFAVCRPGQEEAAYRRIEQMIQTSVPEFQLVPPVRSASRTTGGKD
jgi:hypothetical protein